jgi:lipopolysaccharide/colanic/teichoic acid biosynthesis glycosyltransferase
MKIQDSIAFKKNPLKRIFDVTFSFLLLLLTIPFVAAIALGIWLTIGRPILFSQHRAGIGMREFRINKLRTMRETRDSNGILLPDSERQTPFTRMIRRSRLDEIPQLISVLSGDMSLVGPRPLLLSSIKEFEGFGQLRCSVAPGLTGWAQVNGNTQLTTQQKLALDIWYIHHRNMILDFFIILLTIRTLLLGEKRNNARLQVAENYLNGLRELISGNTKA